MKVAVVLTGHLRCWKQVFSNFEQTIINRYNPDIYIHTWSDEGWWIPGDKESKIGVFENTPMISEKEVVEKYNPKEIIIQEIGDYNQRFLEESKKYPNYNHRPQNILSMYYKLCQGLKMLDYTQNYDMIIRMRPDLIFHQHLPEFEKDTFYTLSHRNHLGQGTSDMIQVGNSTQMQQFATIYDKMESLYNVTGVLCPHVMTESFIRMNGMHWKEFYINKTIMHTPKGEYVEIHK